MYWSFSIILEGFHTLSPVLAVDISWFGVRNMKLSKET